MLYKRSGVRGAKAHIWQNTYSREGEKTKAEENYTCCEGGRYALWWNKRQNKKTRQQQQNGVGAEQQRNANKKWEMPRLFPTKWKVLFNIIVPCLPEERFSAAFLFPFSNSFFLLLPEPSRWYCVLLPQEEAKQQKPIFHFGNNNFPHIIWGLAEGASEREYLKNDEKFPFSAFCFLRPPPPQAFFPFSLFPASFYLRKIISFVFLG